MAVWVWLQQQPVNEQLIDLLWDLETVAFLLPQGFPLAGNC